ncbi:hypothetical protein R3P38DRAFT_3283520 [Favolaschia claudopus]|uniref:Uncharacterized protein n=1 Tax=Favolaschia claudopus TaxID=2862362 RepID=A0AAW0A7F1_9AGAR
MDLDARFTIEAAESWLEEKKKSGIRVVAICPGAICPASDHQWVADLWPERLRFRALLGIPDDEEDVQKSSVVPRTYQGLLQWAYVGTNPSATDSTRTLRLLYREPSSANDAIPGVIFPVGVRVQGFVMNCNLRTLGNWTRGTAPASALQFIVLGGGDCPSLFAEYRTAVTDIVRYIHRCLNSEPPDLRNGVRDEQTIFAARRVFTKINARNNHLPSVIRPGDDPLNETQSIQHEWRPIKRLSVGLYSQYDEQRGGGELTALDPLNIAVGDFVDVCLGFDIVTKPRRGNGQPSLQVHLTIEHIIVLAPAGEATDSEMTIEYPVVEEESPGLTFG